MPNIVYTYTDESPAMATLSFLPILKRFLTEFGIKVEVIDISLASRILAKFPDDLKPTQKVKDSLHILSELVKKEDTNIIKLPNISASLPQLLSCIKELQEKGYEVPDYIANPSNEKEKIIFKKYQSVLGSAVNPVLREGNSERRCPEAVKKYEKLNPHINGKWSKNIKTEVFYMHDGDFYSNEQSIIIKKPTTLSIKFIDKNNNEKLLKNVEILDENEVIDATFMSSKKLDNFIFKSIDYAKNKDLLYSVHLKATMMKKSDPVIFGHFIKIFFKEAFCEFKDEFKKLNIKENDGLKELFSKINTSQIKDKIYQKFEEIYIKNPSLAMVDCKENITNFHTPNSVIIDASMASVVKNSGQMMDKNGEYKDCLAVIPDKTYALIYESIIKDFKNNKELDPSLIGTVCNIGLMAKKAEEYGSHDKTFILEDDGIISVCDDKEKDIFRFNVEKNDIFRMMQTKDIAIKDWVKLAINRAKITKESLIFWLDKKRAHDKNIIKIVKDELQKYNTKDIDVSILSTSEAMQKTLDIIRSGKNCISVTGNVLRDYLTDLFPILELGSSSKMLSIVPLLNGGAMFETGAGGTAPMLAQQVFKENHLSWDSLGEFVALVESLDKLSINRDEEEIKILSKCLDRAILRYLEEEKAPKMKSNFLDTKVSHFYIALYLAKELCKTEFKNKFEKLAENLEKNKKNIIEELLKSQGKKSDLGGYYLFDLKLASDVMRPSFTLNKIIEEL